MANRVDWYGDQVLAKVRIGAMRGVVEGIGIIDQYAVKLILQGAKTGRVYRRRGVLHQASAPGQPPASDTGTLVNTRRIESNDQELRASLIFSAEYAAYLERGTLHMGARPFARRSVVETKDRVGEVMNRNVAQALHG